MKRKTALAIAATVAMVGATGIVTVAALTGMGVLGVHVGSAHAAASTAPASAGPVDAPPSTLAPVVVVRNEYVDEIVLVSRGAAPEATPVAYVDGDAGQTEAQAVADPATRAATTAPAAAPAASTAAPVPPAVPTPTPVTTTATTVVAPPPVPTTPATTRPAPSTTSTATTVFDKTAYPFSISIPSDWGAKQVPAPPTASNGRQWKSCELHDSGRWECEYA